MFTQIDNALTLILSGYVMYLGFLVIILIASFFLADILSIDPNRNRPEEPYTEEGALTYKASRFGFFVKIKPGMQIIITRAGRFVTLMMDHPGYTFDGWTKAGKQAGLRRRSDEHWEVTKTPHGEFDAHPIPFRWNLLYLLPWAPVTVPWWICKRIIYLFNGQVFVGIPGIQGPLLYAVERFEEVTRGDGKIEMLRVKDFTHFFYVRQFPFWFPIGSADTKDLASIRMFVMLVLWTRNAYSLAFRTGENWSTRVLGTGTAAINNTTRAHSLKAVLGSTADTGGKIGDIPSGALDNIRKKFAEIGLGVHSMDIVDRSAADPDLAKSFQQEALASVEAAARLKTLDTDVLVIEKTAKAIQEGGAAAVVVAQFERDAEVVKAAGDRAIISIGGGSSEHELLAALLKETKGK